MQRHHTLKRKILGGVAVGIAGTLLLFGAITLRKTDPTTIRFTDTGFVPDQLAVPEGTLVTFRNDSHMPVWPASNPHPVHTDYSGFDPRKALLPGQAWRFRFTKTGEWRYHNHIGSSYSTDLGSVVVYPRGGPVPVLPKKLSIGYCTAIAGGDRFYCWVRLFKQVQQDKGTKEAFTVLNQLYHEDPSFGGTCNDMTHRIGGQAYVLYKNHLSDVLIPEALSCNAGFFHGLMEVFISDSKNLEKAREFCEKVTSTMSRYSQLAPTACYHGFGHGVTELLGIHTLINWDAISSIITQGVAACERFPDVYASSCVNGMFNSIFMHYRDLTVKPPQDIDHNPFWFCPSTPVRYQRLCYEAMSANLFWDGKRDLRRSAEFLATRVPKEQLPWAMRTVVQELSFASVNDATWDSSIAACTSLDQPVQTVCLHSFAEGLIDNGSPGKEYELGIRFCESPLLGGSARDDCYRDIVPYTTRLYHLGNPVAVCKKFPSRYQSYCVLPL